MRDIHGEVARTDSASFESLGNQWCISPHLPALLRNSRTTS